MSNALGIQSIFSSPTLDKSKLLFQELKGVCLPLRFLGKLDSRSTRKAIDQLSKLVDCLQNADRNGVEMRPDLLSFVLVHMTELLGVNEPERIADQVMERILVVMELLFRHWWWTCDLALWDQIFMLAGVVIGGPVGKGKSRERDDETKEAAVRLLITLTRNRVTDQFTEDDDKTPKIAQERFNNFVHHAHESKLIPIVGKTLDSLLATASSEHRPLQQASLHLLGIVLSDYMPQDVLPTVLPGVVSTSIRIALGQDKDRPVSKGWANGDVVASALKVLSVAVVKAMGDAVCIAAGIARETNTLEDIFELSSDGAKGNSPQISRNSERPYITQRTISWLRGSASQLLVALNSLTPLAKHPSPFAQQGLVDMSATILGNMRLTLPEARPLLLTFLLSLSTAHFDEVSHLSRTALLSLLAPPSKVRHDLLQALLQATADNLSALPRLLLSRSDSKIEFVSAQVEAACLLPFFDSAEGHNAFAKSATSSIRSGVGKLLGPLGHIEKWGWSLLNVLQFSPPPITVVRPFNYATQLSLESSLDFADHVVFPEVTLQHITSRSTQAALERMLHALGRAGGEDCLFAVEWFVNVGTRGYGRDSGSAAALWCACRLLEGVAGITLQVEEVVSATRETTIRVRGRGMERFARWLAKHISDLWNRVDDGAQEPDAKEKPAGGSAGPTTVDDQLPVIEFSKGLTPLKTELHFKAKSKPAHTNPDHAYALHKSFSLQLLCVSAAILQSRFTTLLIHAVYPLLRSFVSESQHLAATALSSLQYITNCTGYASPSNLLLSNFDYALDAVSRRLTRGWLDVEATKVLVVLVRLVGRDVVQRAGDVVEECFDRLDDFHGYAAVVEGIVEALLEVVKVVEMEEPAKRSEIYAMPVDEESMIRDSQRIGLLFDWIEHRHDARKEDAKEDYLPHPREAWGKGKGKEAEGKDEDESAQSSRRKDDDPFAEPPPTPTQALTKQIITRSLNFLTHGSAPIRARILTLLSSSVPVLPESALLPSVHKAWPFVLNRLGDSETYVVSAAAGLIEALATHVGSFMTARVWDDVWPRFRKMLQSLDEADRTSALARRNTFNSYAGTESAYTHSHRLYLSMLRTMTAAVKGGVQTRDAKTWEVLIAFRRFLQKEANEELQACAVELYVAFGTNNEDAVWLVLESTVGGSDVAQVGGLLLQHLRESRWDIRHNVDIVLIRLAGAE